MELAVINHDDYFAKIGDDHKFPINKFGELAKYLLEKKIINNFHKPYPCSVETLKGAHSETYINNIINKSLDQNQVKKIGFPLVDSVVKRSLVATGGTVLASKLALDTRIACNTAGGSHHANFDEGAGYCVFNDVAVAAQYLLKRSLVKKIIIVDENVIDNAMFITIMFLMKYYKKKFEEIYSTIILYKNIHPKEYYCSINLIEYYLLNNFSNSNSNNNLVQSATY